jgi:hypothetical protein
MILHFYLKKIDLNSELTENFKKFLLAWKTGCKKTLNAQMKINLD